MSDADRRNLPGPPEPPAPQDAMPEFAHHIVNRLFSIGLSLDSARSIVGLGPAGDRVAAATDEVDRLIREIRDHEFAERGQGTLAGLPGKSRARRPRAFGAGRGSRALLQEHMARTARALQESAAGYAALRERRADLTRQPGRMDHPAEIKRWRAFADQAEQMAKYWE